MRKGKRHYIKGLFREFTAVILDGSELTPTSDQHFEIINNICRVNYRRGLLFGVAMLLMELFLIFIVDFGRIKNCDTADLQLFKGFLYLHIGLAVFSIIMIVIAAPQLKKRNEKFTRIDRALPGLYLILILTCLSGVSLLDLLCSGNMVVFISSMLIVSLFTLIKFPWSLVVFGVPSILFQAGQHRLSIASELSLSVRINGLVVFIASLFISAFVYKDYYSHILKNIMLSEANKKLNHLASHDPLTGLANRRSFKENIIRELGVIERYKKEGSLLLLDVDHFKKVNDSYGHDTGDLVLKRIAEIITNEIRIIDFAARWGGEEFIIFLRESPIDDSVLTAERLRMSLSECITESRGNKISITVSIGVTSIKPGKGTGFDEAYRKADDALYKAKNTGRNRTVCL